MKDNMRLEKKSFRMTPEEYAVLEKKYNEGLRLGLYDKREGFSGFVRENLLERNGVHTVQLRRQMSDLRYELRKIGVNINQVTKKINGGLGNVSDIRVLQNSLLEIEDLFKNYEEKVDEVWQSQS